ncbi:MAG: hypothetical protein ABSF48_19250 [Thermodesulfobacteriota bacterium]
METVTKKGFCWVHIALGGDVIHRGTMEGSVHLGGVILRPAVEIDGNIIGKDGKLILGV